MNVRKRKKNIKRKIAAGKPLTDVEVKFLAKYSKSVLVDYVQQKFSVSCSNLKEVAKIIADGMREFVERSTKAIKEFYEEYKNYCN